MRHIERGIIQRRKDITTEKENAAALKAKQDAVSVCADKATLPDIAQSLGDRFQALDDGLHDLANWTQLPARQTKGLKRSPEDAEPTLAQRLTRLEHTIATAAPILESGAMSATSPKNDSGPSLVATLTGNARRRANKKARQAAEAAGEVYHGPQKATQLPIAMMGKNAAAKAAAKAKSGNLIVTVLPTATSPLNDGCSRKAQTHHQPNQGGQGRGRGAPRDGKSTQGANRQGQQNASVHRLGPSQKGRGPGRGY